MRHEVLFKLNEPTTRVLSRGGVIEYHDYNYPHDDIHRARARTQATTHCTSWRSGGSPVTLFTCLTFFYLVTFFTFLFLLFFYLSMF